MNDNSWQRILWFLIHIICLNSRHDTFELVHLFMNDVLAVLDNEEYWFVYELAKKLYKPANNVFRLDSRREWMSFTIYWRNMIRCGNRKKLLQSCHLIKFYESFRASCSRKPSNQSEGGCTKLAVPVSKSRLMITHDSSMQDTLDSKCLLQRPCEVSSSLDGFSTYIWGPAMWFYLHYFSFHSSHLHWQERREILFRIAKVLPCGSCRENFKKNYQQTLIQFAKKEEAELFGALFPLFIYRLHNIVNKCLNKKTVPPSFEKVKSQYEVKSPQISMSIKERID